MPTIYEQVEQEWTEEILTNPDAIMVYSDIMRRLQSGHYDQSWVDVIFQKWARFGKINIADAFAFGQIWCAICNGDIAFTRLAIGSESLSDKDIVGNNKIIQTAIADIDTWANTASGESMRSRCRWEGCFYGGTQGADGYI
jgi:hypothetical protein